MVYDGKITALSQQLALAIAQMTRGKKQKLSDTDIQDLEPRIVITKAYPWDRGDSIPPDLLEVWTATELLDLAAAHVKRRQTLRKDELDRKMKQYASLLFKDQNAHKKRIKAELERDIK